MTESRGHEASPRRIADATARGARPVSTELSAALGLAVLLLGLPSAALALWGFERELWGVLLRAFADGNAEPWAPVRSLPALAAGSLPPLAGLLLALGVSAVVASGLQRGGFRLAQRGFAGAQGGFAGTPRVSLAGRVGREAWTIAKGGLLALVLAQPLADSLPGVLDAWQRSARELLAILLGAGTAIVLRAALALAVLGALDFALAQWLFRRRLRMSRRELREEQRQSEGDPGLAAERRRRARELRTEATLSELSEVSLVLIDGEGRALALRSPAMNAVPVPWIKAEAELAALLHVRAAAAGLPIASEPALLAALWALEPSEAVPLSQHAALRALLVRAGSERP